MPIADSNLGMRYRQLFIRLAGLHGCDCTSEAGAMSFGLCRASLWPVQKRAPCNKIRL